MNSDLTRDVRFTIDELHAIDDALYAEIKKRQKSIDTARANQAAGGTIQRGTLDHHITKVRHAQSARHATQVAIEQIGHQLAAAVAVSA